MTGNLYIFDNSGRNTYQRSTIETLMDKYFVIKTSNQESLNHLVPLDIAGAYVDINENILPEFTDYVSVLNVSDCYNCDTVLRFIKLLAYNSMNGYIGLCKYLVERNSIFYGNRRILIDNDFNVLYISVLNTKTDKYELIVNIKALTDGCDGNQTDHTNQLVNLIPHFYLSPYTNCKDKIDPYKEDFYDYCRKTKRIKQMIK